MSDGNAAAGRGGGAGRGRTKSEVARDYGVSRRWVISLVGRYLAHGEAGSAPRSRRPHSSPARTSAAIEEEIVAIRKDLDKHGHEAGAATIAYHLAQRHGAAPAVSTIWRILTARGFVTPQPHKRPKSSYLRFAAEQPNERWQADITHWTLADGTDVEILHWLDDHARLLLASTARAVFKAPDIAASYQKIAARHGDPATVLTDNGAVFTGRYRGRGRVALEVTLHQRGVVFIHSRPYHPQTCEKVERVHHYRVRHDRIDANGKLTLRHNSRLHHIGLGRRHAGKTVLILVHDPHVRIITTSGQPLRYVQINPDRDYHPQPQT